MTFNAAGVDGMQLLFYPSGYKGCSDGFCSLFLFAPAGADLRCHLWAGGQRREVTHAFERPGAFGRTNFCRWESCVDEETDTVLLALEVLEAQQDLHCALQHPAVTPGDTRSKEGMDSRPAVRTTDSVVKMQRVARGNLEDVRTLPSLWTPQPVGDVLTAPPEGYKSFVELRGRIKPGRRRPETGAGGLRRVESSPGLYSVGKVHAS